MRAALFDADGVPRGLMVGSEAAIARTSWVNHYVWREVSADIRAVDQVPHLSEFPPGDECAPPPKPSA